jgi:hypothetical protein
MIIPHCPKFKKQTNKQTNKTNKKERKKKKTADPSLIPFHKLDNIFTQTQNQHNLHNRTCMSN